MDPHWDRSSALPLVGLEPTVVTAYDLDAKLANHYATKDLVLEC